MWFRSQPKCPINDEERAWVEATMQQFIEMFGIEQLRATKVVLATKEFFPDKWHSPEECVELLLSRVCGYMGVERERLQLEVFEEEEGETQLRRYLKGIEKGVAGRYINHPELDKIIIAIHLKPSTDPNSIIATLAHELSHVLLLAEGRISRDVPNMELMTDLLTVFFGFGVIRANSAVRYGWATRSQGYTSEEMYGYALAVFAVLRDESRPSWVSHLSTNGQTFFRRSQKFMAHQNL